MSEQSSGLDRRGFLGVCSMVGLGQTLLPGALFTLAAQAKAQTSPLVGGGQVNANTDSMPKITPEMIDAAAVISGISVTDEQKKMMLEGIDQLRRSYTAIRDLKIPNSVAPAFVFDPVPGDMTIDTIKKPLKISTSPDVKALASSASAGVAGTSDALAFASVRELAELVKTRKVSSVELTKMYLARLKKYDPQLHFVITLTEDRAMDQAAAADKETAAGKYRGSLHGIPWGGKDLLAVKGYRTTWGAGGFEDQKFDYDATVVKRLDDAGAVLVAKLSMGALAQGDLWFGARTRNPWNKHQGSSGSSAGSASAVAAGCVGFGIGTETLGSISSPSTRCGCTGLRPTFGFVPRTGAMALSWTMDKIGPICRAVEDCALVMSAIYGQDGHDLSVQPAAFNWDANFNWKTLRVGYIKTAFDVPTLPANASDGQKRNFERRVYDAKYATSALDELRNMGVKLIPVEIPDFPFGAIVPVLEAEAAAAFDDLTRSGRDKLLTGQLPFDWPNQFRIARFYSAVDYIQAMRARTLAVASMEKLFAQVDVIVTPSQGNQLQATNLTGHPAVIVPNGIRGDGAPKSEAEEDGALNNAGGPGTPVSLTFLGALYSDARLAAFAKAYQDATSFHLQHPKLD
ncbi:MAG TPA: amidase [Edaphobacter sp.]|jgi:Asp-tRNA(Asn)/Glu-tRNA(Gln) amidotransferase A subunit family amidase|nr:amidase [Edaphobacter sp.]